MLFTGVVSFPPGVHAIVVHQELVITCESGPRQTTRQNQQVQPLLVANQHCLLCVSDENG